MPGKTPKEHVMNAIVSPEWDILDEAMSEFIADIVVAKSKNQKHRRNMQLRRRLESMLEEKRLKKELLEYDFETSPEYKQELGPTRH
jgi:hypothetical protein